MILFIGRTSRQFCLNLGNFVLFWTGLRSSRQSNLDNLFSQQKKMFCKYLHDIISLVNFLLDKYINLFCKYLRDKTNVKLSLKKTYILNK